MKKLSLLFLITLLWSCSEKDILDGSIRSKYYIDHFIYSDTLYHSRYGGGLSFNLELKGNRITTTTNPEEFERLVNYYNDISYNKRRIAGNYAIADVYNTITVTAEKDFFDFKAGENITDFYIFAASVYDYLFNNYTFEENLSEKEKSMIKDMTVGSPPYYRRFVKKIDTVTSSDMTLIYPHFKIFYKDEISDVQNKFTISLSNSEKSLYTNISLRNH